MIEAVQGFWLLGLSCRLPTIPTVTCTEKLLGRTQLAFIQGSPNKPLYLPHASSPSLIWIARSSQHLLHPAAIEQDVQVPSVVSQGLPTCLFWHSAALHLSSAWLSATSASASWRCASSGTAALSASQSTCSLLTSSCDSLKSLNDHRRGCSITPLMPANERESPCTHDNHPDGLQCIMVFARTHPEPK